ncbi:MaoC family dehydratase [Kordiimonas aestuarii]|uniref:MaoC family dehydratase n=1 Tax=Kordiimonas aestuarii TaxID=1005925 RepID=UPI0021D18814|nr:MaoC family dehydratase [Kordiimonas aestuarii]
MFKIFYDDLVIGQKEAFGAYKVTREEVLDFASKYDPQPFHLSDEAAKKSVFGALCASGWHTCAMMMRMMVDHMTKQGVAGMGSPGLDGIEWRRPVFPGDILSVESETTAKRESASRPNIGLVKSTYTVKNQKGETVMITRGNAMIAKRPS